jgi:hypothetical protein
MRCRAIARSSRQTVDLRSSVQLRSNGPTVLIGALHRNWHHPFLRTIVARDQWTVWLSRSMYFSLIRESLNEQTLDRAPWASHRSQESVS